MRLRYTQINYLHRTYLTPLRLSRMYTTTSPNCPRCPHPTADFMHMTWMCPVIQTAWSTVLTTISELVVSEVPHTPEVCLLGILHTSKHFKPKNKFIHLAVALFKRQIAMHWKASAAPDTKTWLRILLKWTRAEVEAMAEVTGLECNPESRQLWNAYTQHLEIKNDNRPP